MHVCKKLAHLKMSKHLLTHKKKHWNMKKVYLSGKMSHLDEEVYKQKFAEAAMKALELFPGEQIEFVNPATLPVVCNTWADFLILDLMYLKDCDAIVMLDNWKDSKGAIVEHDFAVGCGIAIHYLA